MNRTNKNIWWVIVAILIFNVAAIFTIYYKSNHKKHDEQCKDKQECFQDILKKELKLDSSQVIAFDKARQQYHDSIHKIHALMKIKKDLLNKEMTGENPDTSLLYKTTEELGILFSQNRKHYIKHYFELSNICTPEQRKKLALLFNEIFCCKSDKGCNEKEKHKHHSGCEKKE